MNMHLDHNNHIKSLSKPVFNVTPVLHALVLVT